ncbi:putative kinesin heavy chain isoform [Hordeum vulgare]|nr:putative kinesin heavy chain isoform [Hordeum vulgare]
MRIPYQATIEDPNYTGVDDDLMVMCEHGKPAEKLVAFEGISTGRRFLACSLDPASTCGVVQWVDGEWPKHLQNALHKLWLMYEQSKHDNRMACMDHSSSVHNLTEQKNKLQETYEKLVEDVNNLLNSQDNLPQPDHQKDVENITTSVDSSMGNMNEQLVAKDAKITKLKADLKKEKEKLDGCIAELMKDKEKWSIEKSAMECCIADLKRAGENNKRR